MLASIPLALLFVLLDSLSAADPVRITFLPPPMEGTLSLGIYDKAGKLVRTLHREADDKAFTAGLNGFITSWDGKDDAGNPAPAGTYRARGYSVGELAVEGVAYHCNDWFTSDDSPRFELVGAPSVSSDELRLSVRLADGLICSARYTLDGKLVAVEATPISNEALPAAQAEREQLAEAEALAGGSVRMQALRKDERLAFGMGKALLYRRGKWEAVPLEAETSAVSGNFGNGETLWLIEQRDDAVAVTLRSFGGLALRELPIVAGEPTPTSIHAEVDAGRRERIALLEEGPGQKRVRLLQLRTQADSEKGAAPISTWEITLSKSIRASDDFASVAAHLGRPQPFKPEEKISVRLQPNELVKNVARNVDLQIAHDEKGAFLRAADGLPLCRVTEMPHLKWAVMGREEGSKAVTIFQSDGAVVEEFRAKKLANMMAFDAGEYEWSGGNAESGETKAESAPGAP